MRGGRTTQGGQDDLGRTILVVGSNSELAVALRDHLDRAYVTVCEVRPSETEAAIRHCRPCPWMLIGSESAMPEAVLSTLAGRPTLVLWLGEQPPGLPAHTQTVGLYSELAAKVRTALGAEVAGIRLAPGSGLTMPNGEHATNMALEALVAAHPRSVFAPAAHFRGVAAVLGAHGVRARLARTEAGGAHLLEAAG